MPRAPDPAHGELVPRAPDPAPDCVLLVATKLLGSYVQPVNFRERADREQYCCSIKQLSRRAMKTRNQSKKLTNKKRLTIKRRLIQPRVAAGQIALANLQEVFKASSPPRKGASPPLNNADHSLPINGLFSASPTKKNHGATDTIHPLQQYWAQGITLTSKIPNNPPKASLPCTAPPSPPLMTSHPIIQSPTRPAIAPNSPPPCESPTPTRPTIAPNSPPPCESPTKLAIDQLLANIARKGTDERKSTHLFSPSHWVCWTHLSLMQYSNPLPPPINQLGIPSIAQ